MKTYKVLLLLAFLMLTIVQPVMADTKEEPKTLPVFCSIGVGKYRTSGLLCSVELTPDPETVFSFPRWNCHLGMDRYGRVQELCVFGL